ncbi:hypothetical protein M3Y94_01302300 [Aphelenchoides besseyi]|nr:hypothetical protein M3Y94_01302300 [Aphelenchoides besseyi]
MQIAFEIVTFVESGLVTIFQRSFIDEMLKICGLTVCLLVTVFQLSNALNCLQCSGWYGDYPPEEQTTSTCDNSNNACTTTNFCVRIIDPIFKYRKYKTYKADCYTSTTFVSQATSTTIENNRCYNYTDGGSPPKTYLYCFCNDKDYCNGASELEASAIGMLLIVVLSYVVVTK